VQYYAHGQQVRESSGSEKWSVAEKFLMRRLVQSEDGTAPVKQRPITYEEMRKRLVTRRLMDNPRLSKSLSEAGLKHLDTFFAGLRSSVITDEKIEEFIVARQATGASNATINRALAALRQMLSLSKIKNLPEFGKLMPDEPPARQGFIERDQYVRLLAILPEYVRPIFTFGYYTGMRLGELQNLTWHHVDRQQGIIRLEPGDTKNEEAREIPYARIPELAALIDERFRSATHASRLVFTRKGGQPLGSFRKAWIRACIKASVTTKSGLSRMVWACPACHKNIEVDQQPWPPEIPKTEAATCSCGSTCRWKYVGLIFHDLRRTALRNLRRAGVPESVAMKISGHKTREVFERYNIKDQKDAIEAMDKLVQFHVAEDKKIQPHASRLN
jgi:integrase